MKERILLFFLLFPFALVHSQTYTEVAQSLGVEHYFGLGDFGGGVSFYDFNKDGWDDLTLATTGGDSVYFYLNTGGTFQKITPSLIDFTGEAKQVIWADFDNDGDADLFVGGHLSGNHLYENTGNLNLVDITVAAGISTAPMATFGASWADYDKDGFLDLYIVNRTLGGTLPPNRNFFYRNLGNKTFQDVTMAIGVADSNKAPFCASFFDYNNDGWEDLYIAHDKYLIPNVLLKNNGNGSYIDVSAGSGADRGMDAMCVAVGDYNDDGFQDIYVTNTPAGNSLFHNNGDETFTDTAAACGVGFYGASWGANFFDYDNDLDLDLYVSGENIGNPPGLSKLYSNDGTGNFVVPAGIGFVGDTLRSFSNALGDIDNDGYMDIAVTNFDQEASTLWKNSGGSNHWLKLDLEGTISNRDAVGTRIEYWVGGQKKLRYTHYGISFIAQNTDYECISLGAWSHLDSLRITWTNGLVQTHYGICANQTIHLVEANPVIAPEITSANGFTICVQGDSLVLDAGAHSSYAWSTGDSTRTIAVTTADSFWVEVTTNDGICARSKAVTTVLGSPPVVQPQVSNLLCNGDANGQVFLNATGGTPPLTYQWSSGDTTASLSGLTGGSYFATVTDDLGCQTIATAFVVEPAALSWVTAATPTDTLTCQGSAWAMVSGGTAPYSFLWNDPLGQTSDTATGLCPGNYMVWITDANSCLASTEVSVLDTTPVVGLANGLAQGILVYPNPSPGLFRVQLPEGHSGLVTMEVHDLAGRRLRWIEADHNQQEILIDLNALPDGLYLLTLQMEGQLIRRDLLLQRP